MKSNNIMIIIVTLLVAGVAYWYFFTDTGNELPVTAVSVSDNPAKAQFRALVGQLQSISFNTTLFSDPNFMSLVDIATPVTEEVRGRADPFAVIPGVTAGK